MSNKQKEEDRSSTTGSDFEPINTPQQGQELELEQPTVGNQDMDNVDGKWSGNNDAVSSYCGGEASIGELEKKLIEEKMKVAVAEMKAQMFEMKAEKEKANAEKAEMKAEMMKMEMEKAEEMAGLKAKLQMMEMEKQMEAAKSEEEKQVAEVLAQELRAQLQAMLQKTIKEEVPKSLKRMEEDARAGNVTKFVEEERLKDWLTTGAGQLRNVSILRDASNKLISFGGWIIHDGRLKATKSGSGCACVRAEKPFPVAVFKPAGQLLYYFEVIVIAKGVSWMVVGLCGADFPFTSTSHTNYVGNVSGSFGIDNVGTYHSSGKSVAGHGRGNFSKGDVVGCGLLVLPAERRLFFTINGEVWGKPILLGADDAKAGLFPAVSANEAGHQVEFNFGADLKAKPFKYELTQLNVVDD